MTTMTHARKVLGIARSSLYPGLRLSWPKTTGLVMRGWRLYPRVLRMIREWGGSGKKKVHSDYLRVDKINH